MADFMIRFFICNVFISGIIGILLTAKRMFKNQLSSRMQYNLWFLLLALLTVPFIPFRLIGFPQIFSWLGYLRSSPASGAGTAMGQTAGTIPTGNADWMNDFTLSVNSETSSVAGYILLGIWIAGIVAMIILVIKSSLRLRSLGKSALPLQNREVRRLYHHCLEEMGIHSRIPVYSTAFLKSPIIVGLLKPCIYLPIHLISDY
ncbi:MAG TPA: BlaR1 family beta-lactam sensor/signal transducer, partial [Lachnospiraceae bacterium]|nr:BlaR1 family beta-lactam sensor/signal transducer [Lachnospiraceae bacterium]